MYDPNQNTPTGNEQNTNNSGMNNEEKNANSNTGSDAVWNGESYHSGHIHADDYTPEGYTNPSTQWQDNSAYGTTQSQQNNYTGYTQPQDPVWHQSTWQPPIYQDPAQDVKKPKKKRGKKGSRTWVRVVAGVVGGFMISACSIGAFVALVNNGVIQFGTSGSGNAAFTITKMIDNTSSTASSTSTSKLLTKQQVAAKVIPSVVLVQNYQNTSGLDFSGTSTDKSSSSSGSTYDDTSLFGGFGGDEENNGRQSSGTSSSGSGSSSEDSGSMSPAGEGSGVITSSDGYIMTNAHVVEGATALKVVLSNNKSYEAKLIGSDTVTDLALIKIDATGLTAAEFGDSSSLKIGDGVVAVGNPGGSELVSSATFGNISALNRNITDENGYSRECIQTDAAINPGNSGGALANMYGQVIGINSSKLTQVGGTSAEGLGFAIPINDAQPIISSLKQYGYVKDRAVLGISGRMIDSVTARIYGLSSTGFVIQKITNTELTKAGVTIGDMITKIDGTDVASSGTITSAVAKKKAGDTVKLSLLSLQTGTTKSVTVKLIAQTGKSA
ncbi:MULTISPECIES: S1C family serine protease [Caproicibacterium]|uniref:Trypsin-like peptidase domain-containing protein n=1 Tax=Caproicibacterium argilliputei TaxID=3030016 RepID=A0AA97D953_9FIRM|nr:trypsin-like peptidase domain-containing protein [Caproicibacterium argilliputei]WOC32034.1 trypsin-like peptidase domain-containing protein [Caproicibacterium argilliputei]